MTPKGFASITLLRMNQNQPTFWKSKFAKEKGGKLKKNPIVLKMGGGRGSYLRGQFENCLKMQYFQISPKILTIKASKYVIEGLPTI